MSSRYTVSDGKLVLSFAAAEEGGYIVTSPLDPELVTEGDTLEEAFANARGAGAKASPHQAAAQTFASKKKRIRTIY